VKIVFSKIEREALIEALLYTHQAGDGPDAHWTVCVDDEGIATVRRVERPEWMDPRLTLLRPDAFLPQDGTSFEWGQPSAGDTDEQRDLAREFIASELLSAVEIDGQLRPVVWEAA